MAIAGVEWKTPGQLYPTVTWSIAEPTVPSHKGFTGSVPIDFQDLVEQAFATWSAVSQITFVRVPDAVTSDIRLGNKPIDGVNPNGPSQFGEASFWEIYSETKKVAEVIFDVDAYSDRQRFLSTAIHEIGHAIGLDHNNDSSSIMFVSANLATFGSNLAPIDIQNIKEIYNGDPAKVVPVTTIEAKFAALASTLFLTGAWPDKQQLQSQAKFATDQNDYYKNVLQVSNPAIGAYEALGVAYSSSPLFQQRYPSVAADKAVFVSDMYRYVFERSGTAAQIEHFQKQIAYFEKLYLGAGITATLATQQAKGAVVGQMLGFAMTDPGEREHLRLDNTVQEYLDRFAGEGIALVGSSLSNFDYAV